MSDEDIATAAYHEAGHAVAALVLDAEFSFVKINSDGSGLLRRDAFQPGGVFSSRWIGTDAEIMITMAGPLAEGEYTCGFAHDGFHYESAEDDNQRLKEMFASADYDTKSIEPWKRLVDTTIQLLKSRWHVVERISSILIKQGYLSYTEAVALLSETEVLMDDTPAPLARRPADELGRVEPCPALDLAVAAWLDSKRGRTGSTRTHDSYRDTLADFRAELGRHYIDLDDDGRAVALLAQTWAQGSKRGRPVKPSTVSQRLNILSSFYQFALRRGLLDLPGNPLDAVERPRVESYAEARALDPSAVRRSLAELRAQVDAGDAVALRDLALLRVALTTGRRVAELAGLRWRDVRVEDGRRVELQYRAKGGKNMRDALAPAVAAELLRWLHSHYGAALGDLAPDAAVWPALRPGRPSEPMTTSGVRQMVERRIGANPHRLRHTFAQLMRAAGAKDSDVQARLGHSSLATTGRYLAALDRAENPYADRLLALLDGAEEEA